MARIKFIRDLRYNGKGIRRVAYRTLEQDEPIPVVGWTITLTREKNGEVVKADYRVDKVKVTYGHYGPSLYVVSLIRLY